MLSTVLLYLIAAVWLANGLFCKVLNLVPRHREIVARILGERHATWMTKAIGFSEILMAAWVLSGIMPQLNAIAQMAIVGTMNVIEFIVAPDLLLWNRLNAVFAGCFILVVYYQAFVLNTIG